MCTYLKASRSDRDIRAHSFQRGSQVENDFDAGWTAPNRHSGFFLLDRHRLDARASNF
jgi:hypothetical protein